MFPLIQPCLEMYIVWSGGDDCFMPLWMLKTGEPCLPPMVLEDGLLHHPFLLSIQKPSLNSSSYTSPSSFALNLPSLNTAWQAAHVGRNCRKSGKKFEWSLHEFQRVMVNDIRKVSHGQEIWYLLRPFSFGSRATHLSCGRWQETATMCLQLVMAKPPKGLASKIHVNCNGTSEPISGWKGGFGP